MTPSPESHNPPVAVLGAGSWGTALALLLAQTDAEIRLWDRTFEHIAHLMTARENRRYLPGFRLPETIRPTANLPEAVAGAGLIVLAVPTGAVRELAMSLRKTLPNFPTDLVLAAKGMEPETGLLPAEVLAEVLPHQEQIVALSGPNLATEVAREIPTAAVAACPDEATARRVARRFHRPAFRVYTSTDRIGVEIGGAVKNVLAIASGVCAGLGYGDNTRAYLLTRGLAEMTRLGKMRGARPETFTGLAGIGDLIATAASPLSRNFRVGKMLTEGKSLVTILRELGQVAEGVPTAQIIGRQAAEQNIEMPICQAVARLLRGETAPEEIVSGLLARAAGTAE